MSESYRGMWSALGLDLTAHDALLSVLGKAYQEIAVIAVLQNCIFIKQRIYCAIQISVYASV